MPPANRPGNRDLLGERTPLEDSGSRRNVEEGGYNGGCFERAKDCLVPKNTLVFCLGIVTLTFVSGMALLGADLPWSGLALVCTALLVFLALCLLPLSKRGGATPQRPRGPDRLSVRLRSEPLPVSMCAHLHMRTINMNVVPYPLEEVTMVDIGRMYPPPFPPPLYQEKVPDTAGKTQPLLRGP